MLEQLTQLVQQYGNDAVVNNAIPNEQNDAVMGEASNSILSGLQKIASEGGVEQLPCRLIPRQCGSRQFQSGSTTIDRTIVRKFGRKNSVSESSTASGVAGSLIPQILGSLVGKAKDRMTVFKFLIW